MIQSLLKLLLVTTLRLLPPHGRAASRVFVARHAADGGRGGAVAVSGVAVGFGCRVEFVVVVILPGAGKHGGGLVASRCAFAG